MEADFTTDNAAAARLRRPGAGTFQRATRTLPAALCRKQSLRLLSNDARAVLSCVAATSSSRFCTTADYHDAKESVAPSRGSFITGSINERRFSTHHP